MKWRAPAAALAVSVAFLGAELAAGGLDFGGESVPPPCAERGSVPGVGLDPAGQRVTLRAIDELACRLGKTREELILDFAERGEDLLDARRNLGRRVDEWIDRLRDALGG